MPRYFSSWEMPTEFLGVKCDDAETYSKMVQQILYIYVHFFKCYII